MINVYLHLNNSDYPIYLGEELEIKIAENSINTIILYIYNKNHAKIGIIRRDTKIARRILQ